MNRKKIPVIFIIFNRPEQALESFQAIKRYKPERLYIAADGPRTHKQGENEKCNKTRHLILNEIDWECDVRKLFRTENVGCGRGVSEGISWMFETEEYGAIIEDDCIVSDDFFPFCEEMLYRYKDEDTVAMVNCFAPNYSNNTSNEYYFTGYPSICAWATWRRAWKNIDFEMKSWPKQRMQVFKRFTPIEACIHYLLWDKLYRKFKNRKKSNAWDFQWSIYIFMNNKLCVELKANLVKNIGFGEDSTNCSDSNSPLADASFGKLLLPLKHPQTISWDEKHEKQRSKEYTKYYTQLLFNKIKKIFKF